MSCCLHILLVLLSLVTIGNFAWFLGDWIIFDIFPRNYNDVQWQGTILFVTTIGSGLVINLGTIIQTVIEFRQSSIAVDFKYTECLLCGCFVLFISQVHYSTIDLIRQPNTRHFTVFNWLNQFASPITTFMSLLCVLVFHSVTNWQKNRQQTSVELESMDVIHARNADNVGQRRRQRQERQQMRQQSSPTRLISTGKDNRSDHKSCVVFVDGTACIGKTTVCDFTFDLTNYIKQCSLYSEKHAIPYIQSMYESKMFSDILSTIRDIEKRYLSTKLNETTTTNNTLNSMKKYFNNCCSHTIDLEIFPTIDYYFFDRSPYSQIAYALLFHYHGPTTEPHTFADNFDHGILRNPVVCNELKTVMHKWLHEMRRVKPNIEYRFLWYGSISPSYTMNLLQKRDGPENSMNEWNLLYYTFNQNHVFQRLHQISEIGLYNETHLLTREALFDQMLSYREKCKFA